MNNRFLALSILLVLFAASCNKESRRNESDKHVPYYFSFNAYDADEGDTKTVLRNGTSVYWSPQDSINVFHKGQSLGVVKTYSDPAKYAVFYSMIINEGAPSNDILASYPYREDSYCDGTSISIAVPDIQKGYEGSFARGCFPSVAKPTPGDNSTIIESGGLYGTSIGQYNINCLCFRNVCGGVTFTVNRPGYDVVTFKGNNDEILAGNVMVSLDGDGIPYVSSVISGKTEVTLTSPGSDGFVPGEQYYISLLPGVLSNGYTMTFKTLDKECSKVANRPVEVKRSVFGRLVEPDAGLPLSDREGFLTFKDNIAYRFDKDGDGKVSFTEVASFTSFYQKFLGSTSLKSFLEFKYFTNVTNIESAFHGCTGLEEIALPSSILTIGQNAFNQCTSLKSIVIPETVTQIKENAFDASLQSVELKSVTPPAVEESSFGSQTSFYIPESAWDNYVAQPYWAKVNEAKHLFKSFDCYLFFDGPDTYDNALDLTYDEIRIKDCFREWRNGSLYLTAVPQTTSMKFFYMLVPSSKELWARIHGTPCATCLPKTISFTDKNGEVVQYDIQRTGSQAWAGQVDVTLDVHDK